MSRCPRADTWRIEENRWRPRAGGWRPSSPISSTGAPVPARERLARADRGARAGRRAARLRRRAARRRGARRAATARSRQRERGGRRAARAPSRPGSRTPTSPSADYVLAAVGSPAAVPTLPPPRGATHEALLAALRAAAHALPAVPMPDGADPLADEDLQLALYCCYELHYRGSPASTSAGSGSPPCSRCAARLEARFEAALLARVGPLPRRARARGDGRRAARDRRRRRRPLAVAPRRARGDARAGARVHGSPLRLPAQGGRPALVGDRRA